MTVKSNPLLALKLILLKDWRGQKYALFAALLALLTTLVVVAYYLNHPWPEPLADTWSYLDMVRNIQTRGHFVDPWRLPGYPLLIVVVYRFTGQGNFAAVSILQALLFVLTVLEIYALAGLLLRRAWLAFCIGLLVGPNPVLLSFIKPLMTEALGLWLLTSLVLLLVVFLSTTRPRFLWLAAACVIWLALTRPEWMFVFFPLFAYVSLMTIWNGCFRRVLPHILAALAGISATLGSYVYINTTRNHFPGVTLIQNINELGKVLQYNMQDEAPPRYARFRRILDSYVAKGVRDPYPILAREPALRVPASVPAGRYAQWIILHHPIEFLLKSVPIFFSSLIDYHLESLILPGGPLGAPLTWLQAVFHVLYFGNLLFPLGALAWLVLLCQRRTRHLFTVQAMGLVILLIGYGLTVGALGAYRGVDYMRIHVLFDPLLTLVIWGTLLLALSFLPSSKKMLQARIEWLSTLSGHVPKA